MSEPDEAAITRLLAEHAFGFSSKTNVVYCLGCEWSEGMGIKTAIEVHRPHLASLLAAHMADREADAWDAGASALDRFHHHRSKVPGPMPPPNPFRLTPDTEGETDE